MLAVIWAGCIRVYKTGSIITAIKIILTSPYRFAQKGQMQRHLVRIHSLESRPSSGGGLIHQCDKCGENFSNISDFFYLCN